MRPTILCSVYKVVQTERLELGPRLNGYYGAAALKGVLLSLPGGLIFRVYLEAAISQWFLH